MTTSDKVRMVSAQINGAALHAVQAQGVDEAVALTQIAEILTGIPTDRRQEALDQSAAMFVEPDVLHAEVYGAAAALLARAGADCCPSRTEVAAALEVFRAYGLMPHQGVRPPGSGVGAAPSRL